MIRTTMSFLVNWRGYGKDGRTWEPYVNLFGSPDIFEDFQKGEDASQPLEDPCSRKRKLLFTLYNGKDMKEPIVLEFSLSFVSAKYIRPGSYPSG